MAQALLILKDVPLIDQAPAFASSVTQVNYAFVYVDDCLVLRKKFNVLSCSILSLEFACVKVLSKVGLLDCLIS